MTHEEKVAHLVKDLGQKGISAHTVAPPAYRFLWRLGIEARPPHFASFWSLAVTMGVFFGFLWGIGMWFAFWQDQDMPVFIALAGSALAGVLFGLIMAAYYRSRARKLMLPRWEDYPAT